MLPRILMIPLAGLTLTGAGSASAADCPYGTYATLAEAQTASDALNVLVRPAGLPPEICSDLIDLGVRQDCTPPPPPPTVTSLCRGPQDPDPEARKTLFFNAVIDEVFVTSTSVPPGATAPTAPSVGGTVSGSLTYWDLYNFLAEDLSTDPAFAGLSLPEIDAALPGGIFHISSISLNAGDLQSELFGFSADRDATWAPLDQRFTAAPRFAAVSVGNDFPGAGDFFGAGGVSPIGTRSGFGLENRASFLDAINWYSTVQDAVVTSVLTACGDDSSEEQREAILASGPDVREVVSGQARFLDLAPTQAASMRVEDRDSADLIPGTGREIGQTIYPVSSGATLNLFDWSFTQFGTPAPVAPLDLSPLQGLGSGSFGSETCNNGLETIGAWYAGLEPPTFAPSQSVTVRGRITSLSPTLALNPLPPVSAIPVPGGLPLAVAGLGALAWLRRRNRRAD